MIDPSAAGPMAEQARLDFGREGHSLNITKRDLRVLKDEGLIYFHWHLPDRGTGRLSSLAFEAVKCNFNAAESADPASSMADARTHKT